MRFPTDNSRFRWTEVAFTIIATAVLAVLAWAILTKDPGRDAMRVPPSVREAAGRM